MATVTDIIDGAGLTWDSNGVKCTRIAIVSDVTGSGHARLFNAVTASGIPARGAAHPSIPGIFVDSLSASPADDGSTNIVKVSINYKSPDAAEQPPNDTATPQLSIGSSVQSVNTNKNSAGALMIVSYDKETTDDDGNTTTTRIDQTGEVSIQVPQTVFSFTRKETVIPEAKSIQFVGRVNAGLWHTYPARTWLCTRIHGDFAGDGFDVSYEFQYNPNTWDATVVFIDPETNTVPSDIVNNLGIKTFQVYQEANFSLLGV